MKITAKETPLKGCFMLEHKVFTDVRGLFYEQFNKNEFETLLNQRVDFVQDNHSISKKGVLRGLHFQKGIHAQSKLVRVVKGEVLDVVVDIRKESKTFGQHVKIRLSDRDQISLFIPKGMAHGFLCLSEEAVFMYKCDNYYDKESEGGIIFNDDDLAIDWEYPSERLVLSEKDKRLPTLKQMIQ